MVLHLLDELARELDRLHVRAKGTAEDTLEKAFDLVLDVPEDAHAGGVMPRVGTLTPGYQGQHGAGGPCGEHEWSCRNSWGWEQRNGDQPGAEPGDRPEAALSREGKDDGDSGESNS